MIQFIGYQKQSYKNRDDKLIEGYQLYFVQKLEGKEGQRGLKPWLAFNQQRKQLQNWFVGVQAFERMQANTYLGKYVQLFFNEYGSITSIIEDPESVKK